jgi:hypothetical protein
MSVLLGELTKVTIPWWGILLIILAVILVISGVVTGHLLFKRNRKMNDNKNNKLLAIENLN